MRKGVFQGIFSIYLPSSVKKCLGKHNFGVLLVIQDLNTRSATQLQPVMHDSGKVLILIPIRFQPYPESLIPIPIPVKSAMIPESIPIVESESRITGYSFL